jgi:hypothetical protein
MIRNATNLGESGKHENAYVSASRSLGSDRENFNSAEMAILNCNDVSPFAIFERRLVSSLKPIFLVLSISSLFILYFF